MCETYKNLGKTFLIIPVAIYQFLPLVSGERTDASVTQLLIGAVFGQISDGDYSNLILIVGKLVYLFMFHLLFGTYISGHFTNMPAYYFARISHRCVWFGKQCLFLFFYALWYALLFLGGSFWGCCMTSSEKPDQETWHCFFILLAVCVSLLMLTTLVVNLGIIFGKTGVGFLGCWVGIIILEIIAKGSLRNPWISFINPMSYSGVLVLKSVEVQAKILYLYSLTVVVAVGGTVLLKNYDISLREVE